MVSNNFCLKKGVIWMMCNLEKIKKKTFTIHQKWTSSIGSKQRISIGLDDEMVKAKGRLGMNR